MQSLYCFLLHQICQQFVSCSSTLVPVFHTCKLVKNSGFGEYWHHLLIALWSLSSLMPTSPTPTPLHSSLLHLSLQPTPAILPLCYCSSPCFCTTQLYSSCWLHTDFYGLNLRLLPLLFSIAAALFSPCICSSNRLCA